jgi:gag-polypeptide of LTR copia-type/Domain of unknown function (DUF4219)/Zinc knuckle
MVVAVLRRSNFLEMTDKITIEPFDVDNWATWSFQMKMLLIYKDLWEAIASDSPSQKVNDKALANIALHVKTHHASTLKDKTKAKDAWDALKKLYETKSLASRMHLMQELQTLTLGEEETMTVYFARVRELRDRLIAIGDEVKEVQLVLHLLNGLPSQYDIEKVMVSCQTESPTLDKTFEILLRAEQRDIVERSKMATGKVLYTKELDAKKSKECWYCGKKGHIKKDCMALKRDEKHGKTERSFMAL